MKIPKSLKVGCYDVKLEEMSGKDAADKHGDCDFDDLVIRYERNDNKDVLLNTLIHEPLHALWRFYDLGASAKEEKAVTLLSNGLHQLLKDNPEYANLILKGLK